MPDLTDKQFWQQLEELEAEVRRRIESATADLPDGSHTAIRKRVEKAKRGRFFFYEHYLPHMFSDPFTEYHEELADKLDDNVFLLVTAFRGWGKSTMVTHADTLRELVVGDTSFAVLSSRTDQQTFPLVLQLRLEFECNKRLIQDFGDHAFGPIWQMNHFVLRDGREVLGRSLKSGTRGPRSLKNERPNLWVFDDLQEKKDAKNPEVIEETVDYINSTARPALNPRRRKMRVVGTYVSEDCALSKLKHEKKWAVFELPAMDKQGRPADPERFPKKFLDEEKMGRNGKGGMGTDDFNMEYMLLAKNKSGMVRREWVKYYRREQLADVPLVCGLYEDPATSADSDYKAIESWGLHVETARYFCLHAFIRETASPDECAAEYYRQWHEVNRPPLRRAAAGFESNGFQELILYPMEKYRAQMGYEPIPMQPVENLINKDFRVRGLVPTFEFGEIYFLEDDEDQELLVDQWVYYPKKKRDGPDAQRGCFDLIHQLIQPNGGIFSGGRRPTMSLMRGYMH